ncbi:hypothetical protein PRZ48_009443 [Zasmidium cellare]|uniref:Cytochrome P450 n=1 Tax=Zasmidium cellare TaxID=395010 RepID=A0ABR0ECK1_ZASCE|nr:hypothetical protein PRZ48_009443 [Zasmidium cellare]
MLDSSTTGKIAWAVGLLALIQVARFFVRFHHQRSLLKGLPGPPHSYFFGSVPAVTKVVMQQPQGVAPQTYLQCVKDYYNLGDYFYFDPWPLGPPIMAIFNVDMVNQVTMRSPQIPKHPLIADFMKNFGGPGNLVSSEGNEWKKWRSAFNSGFATSYLMTTVPMIVEECDRFCKYMEQYSKNNELFRMEQATTKLTVQIIGKIVLDVDLQAWKGQNPLLEAFKSQVRWQKIGAQFQPSELWDIRRPIIQRYNNWKMDRYLSERIEERFASREGREKTRHVVDLALESYLKEVKGTTGDASKIKGLDPEFKEACISNMKTFIFAGHDTTSSTICYAFYYLSKNPEMLAQIRREHDEVFGPDPNAVADKIRQDPFLLNRLDYTLNVTKEVLRLQPPASTVRKGEPGLTLHDPETGANMTTDGFMLWPVNVGMHRQPKYWKDPHTFNPARFSPTDTENNTAAWIPFSRGSRNCIGQELALIETKVILAMIIRKFDFHAAYDELEKLKGDGSGYPCATEGIQEQFGERAYQVQLGTAKPCEGMPCRIMLR